MSSPNTGNPYNAAYDANRNASLIAVSGTVGTSDTAGTAETVRVGVNPATGALYVQDLSGAAGTTNIQGSVIVTSGTVTTTLALNSGTITTIAAGTQNTLGTVGTVIGAGTISNLGSVTNIGTLKGVDLVTRIGNIGTIESGTITTTLALNSGTITTIAAGTQNTLGTVGSVTNIGSLTNIGTIKEITNIAGGTFNLGSVTLSTALNYLTDSISIGQGTVGGAMQAGSLPASYPIPVAGTDSGGTLNTMLVDATGVQRSSGSVVMTVGTVTTGSLTNLASLINGSVNILTGTVTSVGTNVGMGTLSNIGSVNTVTTVSNLTNGSVRMTVGTLTTGSLTDVAKVYSGTINVGTFVMPTGTITTIAAGTQNTLGTVGVVNSIAAGTQNTLGTVGVINNGTITTTVPTGFEGGTVSVGTAAVELTFTGVTKAVFVTADHNNGTMIYIGPSTVAQTGSAAVTRLDPGESLSIDINDAAAPIYAVAGTTSQKVYKLALT